MACPLCVRADFWRCASLGFPFFPDFLLLHIISYFCLDWLNNCTFLSGRQCTECFWQKRSIFLRNLITHCRNLKLTVNVARALVIERVKVAVAQWISAPFCRLRRVERPLTMTKYSRSFFLFPCEPLICGTIFPLPLRVPRPFENPWQGFSVTFQVPF